MFLSGGTQYKTTVDLPAGADAAVASVAMPAEPDHIAVNPDFFYVFRLTRQQGWSGPSVGVTLD